MALLLAVRLTLPEDFDIVEQGWQNILTQRPVSDCLAPGGPDTG